MNIRRSASFLAIAAATAGTTVFGAGTAVAADDTWCTPDDLRVSVSQVNAHEFQLNFEARNSTTDCTLQGYPQPMSFHFVGDQVPVDFEYPGEHSPEVRITPDNPAQARISQDEAAAPAEQQPSTVLLPLPTADDVNVTPKYVAAQWPDTAELASTVTVGPVLPA
ncbi:DUF4232 domain-containing protein [Prauserella cavernicola]|uniref:DUF4232 domain-containing protein n=1 Tax=Prauserella cavernicola TaxID=2800127 RepID=A0A934QQ29_9PSEU|nr:DUF4232 domain-containing protein [Prauserella cavernicola]MBK1784535.1 DUF4232 domain-containing protein [Prauserella cavernicola]